MNDKTLASDLEAEIERNLQNINADKATRPVRSTLLESAVLTGKVSGTVAEHMKTLAATLEALDSELDALTVNFNKQIQAIRKRLGAMR